LRHVGAIGTVEWGSRDDVAVGAGQEAFNEIKVDPVEVEANILMTLRGHSQAQFNDVAGDEFHGISPVLEGFGDIARVPSILVKSTRVTHGECHLPG
jgi:hypothetical protein